MPLADRQPPPAVPLQRLPQREPQLFRFRLRQMFWFVAGVSALLALMVSTEGAWPWVIGGATLLVGAHVLSTMVGTRLRDHSRDLQAFHSSQTVGGDEPAIGPRRAMLPPPVTLSAKGAASRFSGLVVAAGVLAGGILGGVLIDTSIAEPMTWSELGLGAVASGVLGGWVGCLAGGFGFTSRCAWKEASGELLPPGRDPPPR